MEHLERTRKNLNRNLLKELAPLAKHRQLLTDGRLVLEAQKSEILTLRWKQVDFSGGMVRLELGATKNDKGRVFPFGVFHWNDRGTLKPIHPKALYHRWKAACRLAGVPMRIPHDFRRTAVRNLERAGVPRSVAMKLTGHKTEAVYRRYAIMCEADLTEGLKKPAVPCRE